MRTGKTFRRPQAPAEGLNERGHGTKSKAVRERAVLALLSERTIGVAAERSGVHERTLRRWLSDDPEFASAYNQDDRKH